MDCLDLDWPTESVALPTPSKQTGDLLAFSSFPSLPLEPRFQLTQLPYPASSSSLEFQLEALPISLPATSPPASSVLLTPDSSLPGSPLSEFYTEADTIDSAMSYFDADDESYQFSPYEVLPPVSVAISPLSTGFSSIGASTPLSSSLVDETALSSAGSVASIVSLLKSEDQVSPLPTGYFSMGASTPLSSPLLDETLLKSEDNVSPAPCTFGRREGITLPALSAKRKPNAPAAPANSKVPRRKSTLSSKKDRKREQNKTAALRYRQRKRTEKRTSDVQIEKLEAKNRALRQQVELISNEVRYLQKLWAEVSEAKARKQGAQA